MVHGDTARVPFGMGTYGSRSGAVGGAAILKATDKVVEKAKKFAAHLMEAAEADIELKDGRFTVAGTDKSLGWVDVTLAAYVPHNYPASALEPGLEETAFYDPTNFVYPAGAYGCEVEVDPETGAVEVKGFWAADDFGVVINPLIVAGQQHGGVAQGIGQALLEHAVYDDNGQLVSRLADGLRHAARRRPAGDHRRPLLRDPLHPQPARRQGLRRGRRHRRPAGGGERGPRRAERRRDQGQVDRHAGVARPGLGGDPGGGIREARAMYAFELRQAHDGRGGGEGARRRGGAGARRRADADPDPEAAPGQPGTLVSLTGIAALKGVAMKAGALAIGGGTTHARVAREAAAHYPALAALAGHIGDPAVRNRGTIGGSLANNDPSADYPAGALASGATIVTNAREIAADDYFQGMFATALDPGEIITEVRFPIPEKANYQKFLQPASRFALVGVFVAEVQRRRARGGHRRLRGRRLPLEGGRGGALQTTSAPRRSPT